MAGRVYQYGTSPRKIQPEYNPNRKVTKKKKTKQIKEQEEQRKKKIKLEKRRHHKNIALIIAMFLLLLTVSYRNSLITEKFKEIQNTKQELASIQKTNEQTEVAIESSLNLKNVEKAAKKKLGMQKLENSQKVYITLPKEDYTESATQEIVKEETQNWFQKITIKLFK